MIPVTSRNTASPSDAIATTNCSPMAHGVKEKVGMTGAATIETTLPAAPIVRLPPSANCTTADPSGWTNATTTAPCDAPGCTSCWPTPVSIDWSVATCAAVSVLPLSDCACCTTACASPAESAADVGSVVAGPVAGVDVVTPPTAPATGSASTATSPPPSAAGSPIAA